MNTALIKLLEQNLPNVPYLVLNQHVLEQLLDPAEHYPTRILDAAVNVYRSHKFGSDVYGHIFDDDLLVSMNQEEFGRQADRMLGGHKEETVGRHHPERFYFTGSAYWQTVHPTLNR